MHKKILRILILIPILISAYFLLNSRGEIENEYIKQDEVVKTTEPKSLDIVFVGDIMLDRAVAERAKTNGFEALFENITSVFNEADIIIGNLEGTITENDSISSKNNSILRFTFGTTTASFLKDLGFTGVSLANNHALDFGGLGFEDTVKFLTNVGIFSFGSPRNDGKPSATIKRGEEDICFVGYHSLFVEDVTPINVEIKKIKPNCDFLVVVAHWGAEYQDEENESQQREGRGFIDAGADLIIGGHPHVIQPVEIYKGKPIFYSLGNFMFDQDFSVATKQGLAIRMTLSKDSENYHLIPVQIERSVLSFPEKEAFKQRMDILISKLPEDLKSTADIDSVFTIPRN